MKALIATNHLAAFAGSEIVALEFARELQRRGHDVTVFANLEGTPIRPVFRRHDLTIVTDASAIRPLGFDLVYMQHHVAPLFDYGAHPDHRERTLFAFGRLSPRSFMESSGWGYERALGDVILANSPETAAAAIEQGATAPVMTFHNAAPADFFRDPPKLPEAPRRILAVSNHLPGEVVGAVARLEGEVTFRHIGRDGEEALVTPDLIAKAHLVITIGKTVQYALAGGVPVFVYDHAGGPGYLTADNFAAAAHVNFSGRCAAGPRGAADLARAIAEGYRAARSFRAPDAAMDRFRLDRQIDALLAISASDNAARRARIDAAHREMARERLLAAFVAQTYRERLDTAPPAPAPASTSGFRPIAVTDAGQIGFLGHHEDMTTASSRFRLATPLAALRDKGVAAELYDPAHPERYRTIVFVKAYGEENVALAERMSARGTRVIFDLCDHLTYNPDALPRHAAAADRLRRLARAADVVTCPTPTLADYLRADLGAATRVMIVADAAEDVAGGLLPDPGRTPPALLWYGVHGSANAPRGMEDLLRIGDALIAAHRRHPFELVVSSNSAARFSEHIAPLPIPTRYVEWSVAGFRDDLARAAAVVLPLSDNPFVRGKSHNRLTTALNAGVPVVCDPLPAYEEFRPFCWIGDWAGGLEAVLSAPARERERAGQARDYIADHWSHARMLADWQAALDL